MDNLMDPTQGRTGAVLSCTIVSESDLPSFIVQAHRRLRYQALARSGEQCICDAMKGPQTYIRVYLTRAEVMGHSPELSSATQT